MSEANLSSTQSRPEAHRSRRRAGSAAGLVALLAASAAPGNAAVFCVDTAAELVQAMTDAAANGVADEIRVVAGTYVPSTTPTYQTGVSQDLTLSGGWSATCLGQRPDPDSTTIDGANARRVLSIQVIDATATVTLRYLTLRNGNAGAGSAGGLSLTGAAGNHLNAVVESCVFRDNTAATSSAMEVGTDLGTLRLAGNLVVGNLATTNLAGASLTANGPSAEIVNNTVAGNTNSGAGTWGGVRLAGTCPVVFANNVFWGNTGIDLKLSNNNTYFLYANDVETQEGTAAGGANNVSVDPQFVGAGDFRLQADSNLIDVGETVQATLPAGDIAGGPRLLGLGPDLGAYESEHLFSDGFELGNRNAWDAVAP